MDSWLSSLCESPDCSPPAAVARILVCAFLGVLFIQSGLDKAVDWSGNLGWLKEHFGKSPLRNLVPAMLGTVMVFEIAAGVLSGLGALELMLVGSRRLALAGVILSALSLLQLFLGQRIAKDYAGAAVIVPYFLLTAFGLFLLGLPG